MTCNLSLALNAPITIKVVCFSRLLKCLRSLYGTQCGPRSDCSYRSSLFWVQAVCFYTQFVSNVRQFFAADDIFRCIFFLGALRVNLLPDPLLSTLRVEGAQWLSGTALDSRPRGREFEPHRRHCVVVLEQDTFILNGSTQEDPSLFNWKIVDGM